LRPLNHGYDCVASASSLAILVGDGDGDRGGEKKRSEESDWLN
jgi:hypothetical protein